LGLKQPPTDDGEVHALTLKSDHFGIETKMIMLLVDPRLLLKSDHFGIETQDSSNIITAVSALKSDHFGIETMKYEH